MARRGFATQSDTMNEQNPMMALRTSFAAAPAPARSGQAAWSVLCVANQG